MTVAEGDRHWDMDPKGRWGMCVGRKTWLWTFRECWWIDPKALRTATNPDTTNLQMYLKTRATDSPRSLDQVWQASSEGSMRNSSWEKGNNSRLRQSLERACVASLLVFPSAKDNASCNTLYLDPSVKPHTLGGNRGIIQHAVPSGRNVGS